MNLRYTSIWEPVSLSHTYCTLLLGDLNQSFELYVY